MSATPKEIMIHLANLATVVDCLKFLEFQKIVKPGSTIVGIKKFIKDHPEIVEHLNKDPNGKVGS